MDGNINNQCIKAAVVLRYHGRKFIGPWKGVSHASLTELPHVCRTQSSVQIWQLLEAELTQAKQKVFHWGLLFLRRLACILL